MEAWTFRPIGTIHSPFTAAAGAPIQPVMAGDAEGEVRVRPDYAEGLADLEGFDRIWLLYLFDRAKTVRLTVTPYMDTAAHGLFSTRAPARPNPIGMSSVRLLEVDGCRLRVAGIDVLDGTPLLDIKPYAKRFDIYPTERDGWLDRAARKDEEAVTADDRFTDEETEGRAE
jgi:tRNA-Thr(GGU) m(6)t(6)A37 methyltransferase TsaA